MRVISGKNRGEKLFSPVLSSVRPTRSMVKAALFNMIRSHIKDSTFLDLFAGCGAVGIQALSEGAGRVFFVEKKTHCIQLIQKNIQKLGRMRQSTIVKSRVESFLKHHDLDIFDFIFMDPPYFYTIEQYCDMFEHILRQMKRGGKLFFEYTANYDMSFLSSAHLFDFKENRYGNTKLGIISQKNE